MTALARRTDEGEAMAKRGGGGGRRVWTPPPGVDLGPEIRRNQRTIRGENGEIEAVEVPVARAPGVVVGYWRDPDDTDARRREAKVIRGARVADPLLLMHRRTGLVTEQHLAAASRLVDLFEVGILGAGEGNGRPLVAVVLSGAAPKAYPPERRLAAMAGFRAALAVLTPRQVPLVGHVVLGVPNPERRDVAAYAARTGQDEKMLRGQLVAALDALVLHFFAENREAVAEAIRDLIGVS